MVVWRLVQSCVPLTHFANSYRTPRSPIAVQQCLKPLEAFSEAAAAGNIFEDWAVLRSDDLRVPGNLREQALAFSIVEATQGFGGVATVKEACGKCPANIPRLTTNVESVSMSLGGCCQVLVLGNLHDLSVQTRSLCHESKPLSRFGSTPLNGANNQRLLEEIARDLFAHDPLRQFAGSASPMGLWQAIWFSKGAMVKWSLGRMQVFLAAVKQADLCGAREIGRSLTGWHPFCAAVARALELGLNLETEYIPAGFSDGVDWWLLAHCNQCGATVTPSVACCPICHHDGGPVPEQKRRIMGWAPYRPLQSLLTPEAAAQLLQTATVQSESKS